MKTSIYFLFISFYLSAQNDISGFWIARANKNPYYGIIYIEKGNQTKIEGITYDKTESGFCSYIFLGNYNQSNKSIVAQNTQLIEKSPVHMAGIYHLIYSKINNKEFLKGEWMHNDKILVNGLKENNGKKNHSVLKVVYERPTEIELTEIRKTPNVLVYQNKGTALLDKHNPSTEQVSEDKFREIIKTRKNKTIHSIESKSNEIIIQMRDYDKEDGDRVSVLVNDVLFRYNMLIKSTGIIQTKIPLNENSKIHNLCFAANNLGSIPPNTAILVLFIDGKKIEKTILTDEINNSCIEIKTP